jgi:hypothetical protein
MDTRLVANALQYECMAGATVNLKCSLLLFQNKNKQKNLSSTSKIESTGLKYYPFLCF